MCVYVHVCVCICAWGGGGQAFVLKVRWQSEQYSHYQMQNRQLVGSSCIAQGAQLGACDHLEGWDREGGREVQEGGDVGI